MKREIILTPLKKTSKHTKLAEALIQSAVSNVKTKAHAFIPVLNMMEFVPVKEDIFICTNGEKIFYHSGKIIQMAKDRRMSYVEQMLFHILFHGLLGHFDDTNWKDKKLSWAVKDIQVDRCMRMIYPEEELWYWEEEFLDQYICDELYFKGIKDKQFRKKVNQLGAGAQFDDHRYWDILRKKQNGDEGDSEESSENHGTSKKKKSRAGMSNDVDKVWKDARRSMGIGNAISSDRAEKMLINMLRKKARTKQYGSESMDEENEVEYEGESSNSYQELLDKIVRLCETVKEEQELDKVLYQYGLDLYGDVPLVEPEEITEKKCLHTIVIAVDTSGSCTDKARKFFREMVAVFEEIKKIGKVEHISYLECDTEIKTEENYYDVNEFIEFGKTHTFRGGGGTEFTPVYEYADNLIKSGEQVDAVIYITDGYGDFPEYPNGPEYPVYLLLDVDDDEEFCDNLWLPDWVEYIVMS